MKSLFIVLSFFLLACSSQKQRQQDSRQEMVSAEAMAEKTQSPPTLTEAEVQPIIVNWNPLSKKVYSKLVERYGLPHESTENMFIWYNNGPWKRTIVHNDAGQNVLEQVVDLEVPESRIKSLARFNSNIIVDNTSGEVSSLNEAEEGNFLAFNLGKDVIDGDKSPSEARKEYKELSRSGKANPLAESLHFSLQE